MEILKDTLYNITHKRKGVFTATVIDDDNEYVDVIIDTSNGGGNESLANAVTYINNKKQRPLTSRKRLRKELIVSMEKV